MKLINQAPSAALWPHGRGGLLKRNRYQRHWLWQGGHWSFWGRNGKFL